MKIIAMSYSFWRSSSRFRIAACTETSREDVGSSHITSLGWPAMALARATRCFSPPLSWRGKRL
ncbi:hypothetical protein ES708_09975 [subsurface metagenome]